MKFFTVPNLPDRQAKAVIVDYRINPQSVKALNKIGIDVIYSVCVDDLYEAVNGHPDMQIHHLGGSDFVCPSVVYEHYREVLPEGAELICGALELKDKYPYDVAYNAAAIGDWLVCNRKSTSKEIIKRYSKIIDVKQGYSKCSIALIDNESVITEDKGIYKALLDKGFDVLLITPEKIKLNGVSCGFIGGSCGLISPDLLAINGNLSKHCDGKRIKDFCRKHGVDIFEMNDEEIYDIGSIIPVY